MSVWRRCAKTAADRLPDNLREALATINADHAPDTARSGWAGTTLFESRTNCSGRTGPCVHESKLDKVRDRVDNCDMAKEFRNAKVDSNTTSAVIVSTSVSLPRSVVAEVHVKAAQQNLDSATLMRNWITERAASEGLDEMPTNPHKPLFVYGTLKPGELGYELIAKDVDVARPPKPATVNGYLWVRDGGRSFARRG